MTFSELLTELGVPYRTEGHQHCRPGWTQIDCPDCSPDSHHFRLGYNMEKGYFSCWSCGFRPTASTLMEVTQLPWPKVKELLDNVHHVKATHVKPRGKLVLPSGLGPLHKSHRRYLERRGFDPDHLAERWGIQGIALSAKLSWRIFLPITHGGEVVSWTTRSINPDAGRRYISAGANEERIPHRSILFGEDFVRHAVIVTEGPFDAIRIGPGAVATMGLGYGRSQLQRISRYPVRVVCFDAEKAAQKRAGKLCRELQGFPGQTFRVVLSGKDPADSPEREIIELRRRFLE